MAATATASVEPSIAAMSAASSTFHPACASCRVGPYSSTGTKASVDSNTFTTANARLWAASCVCGHRTGQDARREAEHAGKQQAKENKNSRQCHKRAAECATNVPAFGGSSNGCLQTGTAATACWREQEPATVEVKVKVGQTFLKRKKSMRTALSSSRGGRKI